jgi:hypothetical protein
MAAPPKIDGDARGWRQWCKDNDVGQNFGWRAIAEGRLKVRRIGKRMLVLDKDGLTFLESLPSGPPAAPANFKLRPAK